MVPEGWLVVLGSLSFLTDVQDFHSEEEHGGL